ncbi:hypothetical protein [Marinobacter gelidimuriae]|uniref:hypothetical protein n=1 Tax=Marinobacter gelidimuriae TaxID=2739064 RepID=UPI000373466D|nr:hypothetical protein [Marinobacter gelidimuriae]
MDVFCYTVGIVLCCPGHYVGLEFKQLIPFLFDPLVMIFLGMVISGAVATAW